MPEAVLRVAEGFEAKNIMVGEKETNNSILSMLVQKPLAFLGAIGIVSMLNGVMSFSPDVLKLIHAFQSVTQPIWDLLLGWAFSFFHLKFPWWLKDYLTMGVITTGGFYRALGAERSLNDDVRLSSVLSFTLTIGFILTWPIVWFRFLDELAPDRVDAIRKKINLAKTELEDDVDVLKIELEQLDFELEYARLKKKEAKIFFDFILWFFILIAFSYGQIFGVVPSIS